MGLVIMKLIMSGTGCRGPTLARAAFPIVVVRTWFCIVPSVFIYLRVFSLLSDFLLTGLRSYGWWILKSFWTCVYFNIYSVWWFLIIYWPFLLTCPAQSSSGGGLWSRLPELDHFQFHGHHGLDGSLCSTLEQLLNGFCKMYNINVSYRTSCSWITWHIYVHATNKQCMIWKDINCSRIVLRTVLSHSLNLLRTVPQYII